MPGPSADGAEGRFGTVALDAQVTAACHRGFAHAEQIIGRAHDSGQLRPDFELADLVCLTWAISQVIRERRCRAAGLAAMSGILP